MTQKNQILILEGPNLDQLGKRDKNQYGDFTHQELKNYTEKNCPSELQLTWKQSPNEAELVGALNTANGQFQALIFNPGAFSHSSIAIYDALVDLPLFKVETHISQVYKRSPLRSHLLTARAADLIMSGSGIDAYALAICAVNLHLKRAS